MTNPTTPEAPEVSEEQRARAEEAWRAWYREDIAARQAVRAGPLIEVIARHAAQEAAREALAWETLIKSSIRVGEIRKHLHPVELGAVIAALKALLDEIPKVRAKIQEGT